MSLFCVWFFILYEFFLSYFFSFSEQDDGHPFLRAATRRRRLEGRQTRLGMCVFDGREEEEEEEGDDEGSRDLMKEQKQQWTRSEFFGEERANDSRSIYHHTAANGFLILLFSSLSFLRPLVCLCLLCGWGGSTLDVLVGRGGRGLLPVSVYLGMCRVSVSKKASPCACWVACICTFGNASRRGLGRGGKAMKKQSKSASGQ